MLRLANLWLTAAAILWLHALFGIPGDYLGQGFPLYPGIPVTRLELALTALAATLPIPLLAALARRFHLRWLALPVVVAVWLWGAMVMINPFVSDFGTTWSGTEPLRALFLNRIHTPLALLVLLTATAWTLTPARRT